MKPKPSTDQKVTIPMLRAVVKGCRKEVTKMRQLIKQIRRINRSRES